MLTKTIEGAQKKVEQQNFLIRKRVLEYDDVMNEQRRVIYSYRREVLEGKDMSDDAREQLVMVVSRMVDTYTPGDVLEEWDLGELQTQVQQLWPSQVDLSGLSPETTDRESLRESLVADALAAYDRREGEFGDEVMRQLERAILLQLIDNRWREHLAEMDYLREGIHLRGFAQIDPLVAYKNEGFSMFEVLMNSIWEEFARMIFHVEVEVAPQAQQELAPAQRPANVNYSGGTLEAQPSPWRRSLRQRPPGRRSRCRRRPGRHRPGPGRLTRAGARGRPGRQRRAHQPADRRQGRAGEDRPQRPLLVRLGQEVQEVPRGLPNTLYGRSADPGAGTCAPGADPRADEAARGLPLTRRR